MTELPHREHLEFPIRLARALPIEWTDIMLIEPSLETIARTL